MKSANSTITINAISKVHVNEMPILYIHQSGNTVKLLQKLLLYLGYLTRDSVTGKFGSKTDLAVKNFQFDRCLPINGIVDQHTWQAIIESMP